MSGKVLKVLACSNDLNKLILQDNYYRVLVAALAKPSNTAERRTIIEPADQQGPL